MDITPITTSAQALDFFQATDWLGLAHSLLGLAVSILLAWLAAAPVQAAIEGLIAAFLPGWAFFAKPFIPSALASIMASITASCMKLPAVDAIAGAAALAKFVHWVNEQPWAVSLEGKVPKVWAWVLKGTPTDGAAKLLILGLLLIGSICRADVPTPIQGYCAGPVLWAGSSLYQTTGDSTLAPAQSALGGVEFAGFLGSWQGNDFSPAYTLGLLGAMDTAGAVNSPAIGATGGFYLNGVPVTIFLAKRLTEGAGGLLWGVGTNVQFSGWVPFLYLGHPGN